LPQIVADGIESVVVAIASRKNNDAEFHELVVGGLSSILAEAAARISGWPDSGGWNSGQGRSGDGFEPGNRNRLIFLDLGHNNGFVRHFLVEGSGAACGVRHRSALPAPILARERARIGWLAGLNVGDKGNIGRDFPAPSTDRHGVFTSGYAREEHEWPIGKYTPNAWSRLLPI
jgi:hypothetical protein